MNIVVKRTVDLSESEINEINQLFNVIFERERTSNLFKEEFLNTSKGYSYHAVLYDEENKIKGHNAYIPFLYRKDDKKFDAVLSVDAMIHPTWRGKGVYRQLLAACDDAAKKDNCKLRIGFPNDNSYPLQIKYFKMREIGALDTYFLPVRIGGVVPKLRVLNFLSIIASFILILISYLSVFCKRIKHYKYSKDRNTFDSYRYQWFDGDYKIVERENLKFVYKKSNFKGKEAIFLMDVFPLSKSNFDKACRYIYYKEFKSVPIIIFVGRLDFMPLSMIRIPYKFEPKHFHFIGKPYDDFISEDVFDIRNWDVNLSNYDLL